MQLITLPPNWDGYREHRHDAAAGDANQEERLELQPGMMVRLGPDEGRRILPGPEGVRFVALGGVPGTFAPSAWTELGAPAFPPRPSRPPADRKRVRFEPWRGSLVEVSERVRDRR